MNALTELYRAEQFPVFQNRMFDSATEAIACPKGDILLAQSHSTGLISNVLFQPELLVYDENYQNEQAVSERFKSHLDEVVELISPQFPTRDLIEVGCGKGYFLQKLRAVGYKVTGLDPTYEGNDDSVIRQFYGPELGLCADGIVLRHVLEHIQDPVKFLRLIRDSNAGRGTIYIEVPCFDWICSHRAWFDVFYEHVNYFRLDNFYSMFGTVYSAGRVFGGQYLYVIADLATLREPRMSGSLFCFPDDFLGSLKRLAGRDAQSTTNHTTVKRSSGGPFIVWGAASKGVIFSLLLQRAGVRIDKIVDINPGKQGRYIPATGLRVSTPENIMQSCNSESTIYVMNSNYLSEIRDFTNNKFKYVAIDDI
jgi:SAM-dependent methyltransferase